MRRILFIGAFALAGLSTAADAATTITLDTFCNTYVFRNSGGLIAMKDTACSAGFGLGRLGTIRGEGKTAIMALQDPANPGAQFLFQFSYPFVTGGTWSLSKTTDGKNVTPVFSGNYSLPLPGQPIEKSDRSITSPR